MNEIAPLPVPRPVASTSVFVGTFAAILLATVLLLFLDLSLARIDRRESDAHAASEYRDGVALLASDHPFEAVERLDAAVAIDRQNSRYALALGEAMLAEGRVADAESTLKGLLGRAENDGAVNLALAHVMVREDRPGDATAYYHRAIFGRWGRDSVDRRTAARFELIDLVARRGAAGELLAELLPLEESSPDSVALRRRVGHLFLLAGSPARAAGVFRELLRRDPRDADAYAGMGEAALALGNFQTARADLAAAARLRPGDAAIQHRLAVADTVLALDPGARGIGSAERYARSRALLARTVAAVSTCNRVAGVPPSDSAPATVSSGPPRERENVATDAIVTRTIDIWVDRPPACAAAAAGDEPLRLLLGRLAQ